MKQLPYFLTLDIGASVCIKVQEQLDDSRGLKTSGAIQKKKTEDVFSTLLLVEFKHNKHGKQIRSSN